MSLRAVLGFRARTAVPGMDPFFILALTPFWRRDSAYWFLCRVRMLQRYVELYGGLLPKECLFHKGG